MCGVRLWGLCRWRLSGCVLCARSGVCAVCWWCVWVPVLVFVGVVWRPCVSCPPPVSAVWFPAPLGWGPLVVCPLAVPFVCPPPSVSFPCRLGRCSSGVVPGLSRLWWEGGGLCRRLGSLPLVFPRGGADACTPRQGVTLLYGPSICTRSVQMDLLRSQVLQPFPTPGSGTLWVAGESLRDRRVSCLPRWTVCPTRSPSLGPNRSTCRGECSWSGRLVTPPGRCHRGSLTNGPGRIPPYCVCSGGADTVTGGAPKPLRLGSSPASPVGPLRPAPLFAVRFVVVGVPSLRGGVVVAGGGGFAVPGCVACVRVAPSSGRGSPSVCVFVARCVRAWCLCWCVVRGLWCVVCGGGVLVGLWRVCGVVGPSPLLAEVPVCYSPPLLAGFRCLWWCAVPRHSWLGFSRRQWRVVCGVWCVVSGGGVLVGLWLVCGAVGWSLATPGGGSRVLLPATPGWVSLPVVVGGPRHPWLRSPGGGGVWWGCGWCVVWLVPRHSWRRFLCATPRHSWLGFAAGGGVQFPATPGWGLLAAVVRGVWCVVCGVWCAAVVCWWGCGCGWSLATPGGGSCVLLPATPGWVSLPVAVGGPRHSWLRALGAVPRHSWLGSAGGGGVWWGCGWCVVWFVPRHSWRRFLCATPRNSWLGFAAGGGVRFPATPGWGLLAVVVRGVWCVVCGVWCAAVVCWRGCGWCVVWLVPRHSWRSFLCATPRHSWLGFAAGGGRRSPPLLAGVRWRRWCVVRGGGVLVGLWLVCGAVGWSLATPGGGSRVLLPATPGWVSLPVVVGGPRHPWLRSPGGGGVWWGCGWCVVWLVPRHSWRRFLCATPRHSWLGFAAGGGVQFPATPGWGLLAAVVRGVWCVVCGVWCAAVVCWWGCGCGWSLATPGGGSCVLLPATPGWVSLPVAVGGPRHSWLRALGAVPRHSWLGSAGGGGVWWGCGWCVVWFVPRHSWRRFLCATPRDSWLGFAAGGGVRFPATPGWGLLAVVVRGVWCVVCGVWCAAVVCWRGCGWCVVWLVPRHSWRSFLCATPRHSWLGFAAGGGRRSPPLLAGVRWRRWCVVRGGGVLVGLWLVCGVVGPSPLLAEVPVCYSPPLLAGFRCRWWWAVLATPG